MIIKIVLITIFSYYGDVSTTIVDSRDGLLQDMKFFYNGEGRNCSDMLEQFAISASHFTLCSILHARPIRLCEECVENYVEVLKKYNDLNTDVNGSSCLSMFISHDRLDAVLENYQNIVNMWDKGNCKACFDWSQKKPQLSNATNVFNTMLNQTNDCISSQDANNTELICEKCMQYYVKLDDYYKSLSKDSIGLDVVCMDIVDSMNTTRSKWSKTYKCCNIRKTPEIIFLCCTSIISMLPVLFYLAVRFCGPISDLPNVLKQSRFKQSILRSINGRED